MFEVISALSSSVGKDNEEPLLQKRSTLARTSTVRRMSLQRSVERALAERLSTVRRRAASEPGSMTSDRNRSKLEAGSSGRSLDSNGNKELDEMSDDEMLGLLLSDSDEEEAVPPPSKLYSFLWWVGVLLAVLLPEVIAYWADVPDTLRVMGVREQQVAEFSHTHPIYVPQIDADSCGVAYNYSRVDESLIHWQTGLNELHGSVLRLKVLDAVSESNLEFAMGKGEDFEPRRDYTISCYFALSILVYFVDNVHLALVLLLFNLWDLAVCFRVKSLDDAFSKELIPLGDAIEAFFLLPMASDPADVAQQSYLLNKMRAMQLHWESASLGISFSVPFFGTVLSLNIGLLISIVAATTVRCLNVVVYGTFPSLPRVNLIQWLLGSAQPQPPQPQDDDALLAGVQKSAPSASHPAHKPPQRDGSSGKLQAGSSSGKLQAGSSSGKLQAGSSSGKLQANSKGHLAAGDGGGRGGGGVVTGGLEGAASTHAQGGQSEGEGVIDQASRDARRRKMNARKSWRKAVDIVRSSVKNGESSMG